MNHSTLHSQEELQTSSMLKLYQQVEIERKRNLAQMRIDSGLANLEEKREEAARRSRSPSRDGK